MKIAGRIAAFFHIDPVAVLNTGYFNWQVRQAAYKVAVEERNKAIEEANKKNK